MSADSHPDGKYGVANIDNSPEKHCEPLASCSLKRPPEEGIVAANSQTKRQRIAKPEGKPRRPLSAYNVFFKEERGKWNISSIQSSVEDSKSSKDSAFRTMTKAIGNTWRNLSADQKMQYEKVASEDMQRYRKKMDEYKLKMIRDTAIGRASLEGRLIRVSGTPERLYQDRNSQQLPQTMKDTEGPQASSRDNQFIAGGEARNSKKVSSTQTFPKEWTASSDTTCPRQAFSRTNSSVLENLLVFQKRTCDEEHESFMATSHQYKRSEQTQQGPPGRNEKAEQNSEFLWEMMRMDPVTLSNKAAVMEADLQSSLPSFTQRHEATKYDRSTSTSEVNPSAPIDLNSFLQQQLLPLHLQNIIHYVQSVAPSASSDAIMSEHLSSRVLQMLLLSAQDKHTPHIDSTIAYSAQAPKQHQPTIFDNPSLGCKSGLQTTRSVMDFLTSQNSPLPVDQQQQEQHRQWQEHLSSHVASDFNNRLHSNIAMQLQTSQQCLSRFRPGRPTEPFVSSLLPNTSSHIPGYSSDLTMAADADARAQIGYEIDNNTTSVAGPFSPTMMRDIYIRSSPHFPLATFGTRGAVTAARSSSEDGGVPTGPLVQQLLDVLLERTRR